MLWPLVALIAVQHGSTVRGIVRDSAGAPVQAAAVTLAVTDSVVALSDSLGAFVVRGLARGIHSFRVRHIAFHPSEFEIGFHSDTMIDLAIELERRSLLLDTIMVVDRSLDIYQRKLRAVGFEERRQLALRTATDATFLTPADIEQRRALRLSSLLEGRRSIKIEYPAPMSAIARGRDGRCVMSLWVDGQLVYPYGIAGRSSSGISIMSNPPAGRRAVSTDVGIDMVEPIAVAAVEIYPSPSGTPPQFQLLSGGCGAIVVWTKQ